MKWFHVFSVDEAELEGVSHTHTYIYETSHTYIHISISVKFPLYDVLMYACIHTYIQK